MPQRHQQQQKKSMQRLQKNVWQWYLHAQNFINIIYMRELWSQSILITNLLKQYSRRHYWQHLNSYKACYWSYRNNYNLQVQYKRGVEINIPNFLSRTFTGNKGEKQQQQHDRHGTCWCSRIYESYWPIICANLRTHKTKQLRALKVAILAEWPDIKNETPLCITPICSLYKCCQVWIVSSFYHF